MNKNNYLQKVLDSHKMSHIEDLIEKYRTKRDDVKETLESHYSSEIYSPKNSGSRAKATDINSKFDLDLSVPFKRNSFNTLEELFDDVYEFLYDKYKNEAEVRKQKVSIGINFFEDSDGDKISLDIVPGRELNKEQYPDDGKLNLHIHSKYGDLEEKTYIQTNIQAQIDHIKGKNKERSVIRLLKIWKSSNNEDFKSFFMELATIKAFEKEAISGSLWDMLETSMVYIRDNVTESGFTLPDPGNSNNDVVDSLDSFGRQRLSNRMSTILSQIERNDENIKIYFPLNEEFDDSDKTEGYGIGTGASYPKTTERFG